MELRIVIADQATSAAKLATCSECGALGQELRSPSMHARLSGRPPFHLVGLLTTHCPRATCKPRWPRPTAAVERGGGVFSLADPTQTALRQAAPLAAVFLTECSKRLLKPLAHGGPLVFFFEHSEAQRRAIVAIQMSRVD